MNKKERVENILKCQKLLKEIDMLKTELETGYDQIKCLNCPSILHLSQKLDRKIIEFQRTYLK